MLSSFVKGAASMALGLFFLAICGSRDIDAEPAVFGASATATLAFIALANDYCGEFAERIEDDDDAISLTA